MKKGNKVVTADGREGEVLEVAPYSKVYGTAPRKTKASDGKDYDVVTVQLDGEDRPRNYPADELTRVKAKNAVKE